MLKYIVNLEQPYLTFWTLPIYFIHKLQFIQFTHYATYRTYNNGDTSIFFVWNRHTKLAIIRSFRHSLLGKPVFSRVYFVKRLIPFEMHWKDYLTCSHYMQIKTSIKGSRCQIFTSFSTRARGKGSLGGSNQAFSNFFNGPLTGVYALSATYQMRVVQALRLSPLGHNYIF